MLQWGRLFSCCTASVRFACATGRNCLRIARVPPKLAPPFCVGACCRFEPPIPLDWIDAVYVFCRQDGSLTECTDWSYYFRITYANGTNLLSMVFPYRDGRPAVWINPLRRFPPPPPLSSPPPIGGRSVISPCTQPYNKTFFCSDRTQSCYLLRALATGDSALNFNNSRISCKRLGGDLWAPKDYEENWEVGRVVVAGSACETAGAMQHLCLQWPCNLLATRLYRLFVAV